MRGVINTPHHSASQLASACTLHVPQAHPTVSVTDELGPATGKNKSIVGLSIFHRQMRSLRPHFSNLRGRNGPEII
jgi:hypothetical protein